MQIYLKEKLLWLENKYGVIVTAIFISLILVLLSRFYYSAQTNSYTESYGEVEKQIAANPFGFKITGMLSMLQYRILTPLIAFIFGLKGKLFFLVPNIMGVLFLSTVYYYFRKKLSYKIIDSVLITSMFAFSSTLFAALRFPWIPEPTSFFFIMLCLIFIDKKIWYLIFAISLLNHESNMFMAPTLLLLHIKKYYNNFSFDAILKTLLFFALAILPMFLWRYYVNFRMIIPYYYSFNIHFIKSILHQNFTWIFLGLFMAFKLFWYFPVCSLIERIKMRDWFNSMLLLVTFLSVFMQFLLAVDITRNASFGFIGIILSIKLFKETRPDYSFTQIFFLNLLIPTCYVTGEYLSTFYPFYLNDLLGKPYNLF